MKTLKGKALQVLHAKVVSYVRSHYTMVDVIPKQGLFNLQCHRNCVEFCRKHKSYGIVEVIYVDGLCPVLHYLNTKDGQFYETTLGFEAEQYEYYIIRTIHPKDYKHICSEFDRSQNGWMVQFGTWYCNLLGIRRLL